MADWRTLLGPDEASVLERAQWGRRAGFGRNPSLLVIDTQNYMVGIPGSSDNEEKFPFSCGASAFKALRHIERLVTAGRGAGVPVIFTRFVIDPATESAERLHSKIAAGSTYGENLYFTGTFGAEIVSGLSPLQTEPIIDKSHRSAFFGTRLLELLRSLNVDCCIVAGGSTSGCIRPTVCDAEQNGFRVVIPEEAVFDRLDLVHAVNLFDMNRSQADVLPTLEVIQFLESSRGT